MELAADLYAAFVAGRPQASWADHGIVGARVTADGVVVTLAPGAHLTAPRSLEVGGRHWPITAHRGAPIVLHAGTPAPSERETDGVARAGALVEAHVGRATAAGTLGWSFFGTDGQAYLMSNWHVLCAQQLVCAPDIEVVLPRAQRTIATVDAFARVDAEGINTWDLAIARYHDPAMARGGYAQLRGTPADRPAPCTIAPPVFGDLYFKVGASTAYREARYAGMGAHTVALGKDPRGMQFARLGFYESVGPRPFSTGGDSGSVVVHARTNAVSGLLIGGFDTERGSVSVTCPIYEAFDVVGCVRSSWGEALPRLDYPARRRTRDLEWVRVDAQLNNQVGGV